MLKSEADDQIRYDVLREVARDTRTWKLDIRADVHDGVESLSGVVPSYAEKIAAVRAAHRIPRVLDVLNEILIRAKRPVEDKKIESLLSNEAERAQDDNPLSRIMNRREIDGHLLIETTTEHLAKRLGQSLIKAFDGGVAHHFSHENKVARVDGRRD